MTSLFGRFALSTAIAALGLGSASAQSAPDEGNYSVSWNSPNVFSGHLMNQGVSLDLADYYAGWQGRKVEVHEGILSFTPSDYIRIWYSAQSYLAKGRGGISRLDLSAVTYGFRAVVVRPDDDGYGGVAIQFEVFRPTDANAVKRASAEKFLGTRDLAFTLMGSQPNFDYQVQYSSVKANVGHDHADVIDGALGRDFTKGKLRGRLEAHISIQHLKTATESSTDLRPVGYARLGYNVTPNISLEGDGSVMFLGMPIAGGRFTPLSSFLIYNPGGAIDSLKSSIFGIASLRLMFHTKF